MKKLVAVLVLMCSSFCFAATPKLVKAEIQPAEASPGDSVTFIVEFTGKANKIDYVQIIVREFAYDTDPFYLNTPDNDEPNIWYLQTQVPYEAPVQTMHLEISAVDSKGKEIITKEFKEQSWGKTGMVLFKVGE